MEYKLGKWGRNWTSQKMRDMRLTNQRREKWGKWEKGKSGGTDRVPFRPANLVVTGGFLGEFHHFSVEIGPLYQSQSSILLFPYHFHFKFERIGFGIEVFYTRGCRETRGRDLPNLKRFHSITTTKTLLKRLGTKPNQWLERRSWFEDKLSTPNLRVWTGFSWNWGVSGPNWP